MSNEQIEWMLTKCDESDCRQLGYIAWNAFEDSDINAYIRPIYLRPKCLTEEEKTNNAFKRLIGLVRNPKINTMKAVDPRHPEIIAGYAVWRVSNATETPEILKQPVGGSNKDPSVDEEASRHFEGALEDNALKIMRGRRHMNLLALATHPKHLRKGVASALIDWGLREADKQGLPVLIESAPHAVAVYERNGLMDTGRWTMEYEVKDEEGMVTGEIKTITLHMKTRESQQIQKCAR